MKHVITFIITIMILVACGNQKPISSPSSASDNNPLNADVTAMHNRHEGLEYMNAYVKNYKTLKDLRLIRYTIEGDPIIYDVSYDEGLFSLTVDTTRDQFGNGSVETFQCQEINKNESLNETKYYLTQCDNHNANGDQFELLKVWHNVLEQDHFEFTLQIDDRVIRSKDSHFSQKDLQKIYKTMVYNNYLAKKSFDKSCSSDANQTTVLKVYINNGDRYYEWDSCDQSRDAKRMNEIKQTILNLYNDSK
ncbi:DUF4362 domain-containing protein [Pontibacillus marinus]|uniref:DUF4362 domain-containing protein n=1 Tax=Pontibacillus marinus BH030004 = DSM 16465 TaxID=1385511 RepID=A0A0A5GEA0_9BACI|nr:DUF4362 domain-containing protein [Pontibacillus marinus]KGX91526.1 hypothetical protein N783_07975 [Pontibacillus marinus BH030004 = DSM 16465]